MKTHHTPSRYNFGFKVANLVFIGELNQKLSQYRRHKKLQVAVMSQKYLADITVNP